AYPRAAECLCAGSAAAGLSLRVEKLKLRAGAALHEAKSARGSCALCGECASQPARSKVCARRTAQATARNVRFCRMISQRSEEHTSELQSRENLVCRLLLEKK